MALLGKAVVCTWNDLVPGARETLYEWHNREHMPERLGIPGFNRGRRFSARRGSPEYCFLYETDSLETVSGAAYLERLNNPTPWTQEATKNFRNSFRAVGRIASSIGVGLGGFMSTMRFDAGEPRRLEIALTGDVMPSVEPMAGITGVHLVIADPQISNIQTTERKGRGAPFAFVPWVLFIEGVSEAVIERALTERLSQARLEELGAKEPFETGIYQMEICRSND